jgi:hypothetical protein
MLWWIIIAVLIVISGIITTLALVRFSKKPPEQLPPPPERKFKMSAPKRVLPTPAVDIQTNRSRSIALTDQAFVNMKDGKVVHTDPHAEGWNGYKPAASDEYYAVPKYSELFQRGYLEIYKWDNPREPAFTLQEHGLVPVFVVFHALSVYVSYFDSTNAGSLVMYTIKGKDVVKTATLRGGGGFGRFVTVHDLHMMVSDERNIHVYRRDSWASPWEDLSVIRANPFESPLLFGYVTALNRDYCVIASPYDDYEGAVYVFSRNHGSWGEKIDIRSPYPRRDATFGFAIALDEHRLWVADDTHVFGFNLKSDHPKKTHEIKAEGCTSLSISKGRLWIGTESGALEVTKNVSDA